MTQHSTRAASPLPSNPLRGRLPKRSWPVRLVLVAALLLAVPFLFQAGATVHAADNDVTGLTLTSPEPGELAITWDAPSRAPSDYRVTWKQSDGKWPSYKNDNTALGGNAFPTGASHTVSDLEQGAEYSVRVRARYHNSVGNVEESGPWSTALEITVASATPSKDGEGRSTSPPAKPTGITYGASHNNALMFWTDPDDDSITGYQILRGPDAANLAVLTEDTGSTDASYSDDTVEPETQYFYAIRARNAGGLGPQSDTISVTTQAAPEELLTELALAGVEFIIAGQTLDTTGTCSETDIAQIADGCTHDITNPMPQFGVVGTLDGDDRVEVRIGRDLAGLTSVAFESDLQGANKRITPTFQPGRNLLRVWGDEDGDPGGTESHYFRINVLPYWEWNGERLSKDSDCRDTTANAPTVDEITDDDCIINNFGDTAELRFFNVTKEHFNVYVDVNGTNVISEPSTSDLGSSFTVNLDAGDNLIRIRLAAKGGQPTGEVYDSDSFYYKVTAKDVLVSNLGQSGSVTTLSAKNQGATQFTTGGNPNGYTFSEVRLPISVSDAAVTPVVSFYSDVSGSPGAIIKTLTNLTAIAISGSTTVRTNFDAEDYKLNANTSYWIVVENPHASESVRLQLTAEDSEDAGFAPGWSIGNVSKIGATGGTFSDISNGQVMQIAVKGALATISDDATLSDLVLTDPDNTVVTLDPTFESGVESYTATVANAVSQIKVEPTKNDDNASIQYGDSNDMVLTDADTNTGVFDFDLAEGENVIKVEVTAEDGTTIKTYQVTVTRVDFLVSNLGQTSQTNPVIIGAESFFATQFTTGTNPGGYTVSKVRLPISVQTASITPVVSIYSDVSGSPGSSIKALTNPASISVSSTSTTEVEFDAGDYKLDAATYWIVVENPSGSDEIYIELTREDSEDAGGAPGWSIGNASKLSVNGGVSYLELPGGASLQFAVKGALATTTPGAPASLSATAGDTEVDLTWTAPASDGGAAITKYQYRVSTDGGSNWAPDWTDVPDGSDTGTDQADERTVTVTGLANGTLHTFQVRAVNSVGSSGEVEATATPIGAPGAPASLTATPGNTQATLAWTPPASDGGAAITKYQYRVSVDGGSTWSPDWTDVPDGSDSGTDQADERTLTITSLTNGTVHTFQVRAVNGIGNGGEADATATPATGPAPPGAPASLNATPGDAQATLTWTAPSSDGNSAITKYQYRVSVDDGTTWNPDWTDVPDGPDSGSDLADERDLTLTGLEAVILHTFQVRAVNSIGDGAAAQATATPTAIITLASDHDSIVRELTEVTFTLTRAGSTAQAADVTLMVENASGDSVVIASGRTETLTFAANDDTVEFAVPLFWIRSGRPTGSFVATVEAPAEYDTSAATATVEVVNPSGTLIEAKLDQNSYNVTEGNDLTFNLVFNVLEEIAAPNRDLTNILSVNTVSGTAAVNDDFAGISTPLQSVPANSWGLVSDRYVATVSVTLETVDDALYERPMGAHEGLEINLQGAGGTPPWVTRIGPTTGTTRYPVTITDDETLNLSAELSSTGLTAGQNLRIDEDAGQDVTLTVTNSDLASDGNPVTLPPGVKLKITPDIPMNRGATETDDWTISPVEIDLGGTATITIIDDMLEEGPESVTFEVGFDDDAAFQSARATLTINDDEYTGPVLQAAEINAAELTLEFSNTLDTSSRPARSAFEVKVRGTAVSLSSSNPVSISGSTVTLRLGSPVTAGDTVTVSYTAPGANPIKDDAALEAPSFTDEPVTNNTPNAPATGKPVISGTPQRAETLTVSTTGIRDADGLSDPRYTYQWVRVDGANEVIITGSNSPSYLLTRDDIGKKLLVRVAFFDDAGKTENLESDQFPSSGTIRNKPNNQPTGRPTLLGTYQVGHTLTASTSGIGDLDGLTSPGYTYQWQRREIGVYTDISGADSMVYTLTADDQGKRVRVQVTFTDDDENVHTLESFPSGVVQAQTSIPSDKVKVSLDATAYVVEEGETIRVTVTLAEAPEDERVIIPFTVTPANGASRSDFAAWSSYTRQLRFDVGDTTDRINVHANDDTLNDDGETLTLCLGDLPEPYATLAGLDCATINIMDNDDPNSVRVTFRSDTYWASEDGNPAWPRISVHPVPDRKITIPITYTRHGGLSEDDYEIVTTSVTFGPGLYGVHGDGHLSDNRTYASFPIEIWAIDDMEDDDGEYMDLAFGALPPFVSAGATGKFSYRPTTARVWFNDNEFTPVTVTDPPNPLGFSKRMRVSFADPELEAREGQYSNGSVATVRVRLNRRRDMESTVIIPIVRNLHGGATDGVDFAAVPDHLIFLPGQTEQSFRVRAINDDIDDDGEYVTFGFGTLPDDLVYVRGQETVRVNLVDDDDPPVDVFFEQANYEVTNVIRDGKAEYARLNVKVKLSAAPERFIDVGIVAESIQGGGGIHFEYSAYIPRGPHDGAHFYADDTEFTLQIYISARGGFDPNQTYRLSFEGMSYKMSVGSPATATITINADP